ncbi:Swt1 family HEPN domain-containing protein [Mesorhizobium sp.]|uniref:Swt1 family HEPN domain-containing protein n=1 Tax=Mesorhizobium sp. TaxID=1871066 RepID=UPI0025C62D13|nr:Swt1 family HEPN domain-containing protein [Mesorhizobium sp.]
MFRGLMFESEAAMFQGAGIQIGAASSGGAESLMMESLAPFGVQLRNRGLEMARLYAVLYCFENEIRDLVSETLGEKEGPDWWGKIPSKIRQLAESRQKTALKDSWLEGDKSTILSFVEFGDLASIMIDKWSHFEPIVPSQHWLKTKMDELEKVRNFIAHNRMLLPSEFQRIYMNVADWNRVIGL